MKKNIKFILLMLLCIPLFACTSYKTISNTKDFKTWCKRDYLSVEINNIIFSKRDEIINVRTM